MFAFFCIAGVGLVVVAIVGQVIDNRLDKKYGVSYDHYGNEIAHNSTGGLILVWCLLCVVAAFVLNEMNLLD